MITTNVLRHLVAQLSVGAVVAVLTYLTKADYGSLGAYAPAAQGFAAVLVSIANEAVGSAPKA
jgi:hypothetical protein